MLATRLLVQKLESDGSVIQSFTINTQDYVFDFNYGREQLSDNHAIFPVETTPPLTYYNKPVGRECSYIYTQRDSFYYSDLYSVPANMMISIILPKGFKPISMGFSESPHIPNGAPFSTIESPGYVYMKHLSEEDIIVLYFMITRNSSFKFSFTALLDTGKNDLFPIDGGTDDYLDYTVRYTQTNGSAISEKDLKIFNSFFDGSADLKLIAELMNKLLCPGVAREQKNKVAKAISKKFSETVDVASNITTLLNFYIEHKYGASKVIAAILMFLKFNF